MNLLQKDIEIHRLPSGTEYEYQLFVLGDPCKAVSSMFAFDFGVVNISPEGSVHMELYRNNESIPSIDMEDKNTFIISIISKS